MASTPGLDAVTPVGHPSARCMSTVNEHFVDHAVIVAGLPSL